jgi:hypothetical protein
VDIISKEEKNITCPSGEYNYTTKKPKTSRGRRWDSHVGMEPLQTTPPARSAATSRAPERTPPLQAQQRLESASSSARCRRWSGGERSRRCGGGGGCRREKKGSLCYCAAAAQTMGRLPRSCWISRRSSLVDGALKRWWRPPTGPAP